MTNTIIIVLISFTTYGLSKKYKWFKKWGNEMLLALTVLLGVISYFQDWQTKQADARTEELDKEFKSFMQGSVEGYGKYAYLMPLPHFVNDNPHPLQFNFVLFNPTDLPAYWLEGNYRDLDLDANKFFFNRIDTPPGLEIISNSGISDFFKIDLAKHSRANIDVFLRFKKIDIWEQIRAVKVNNNDVYCAVRALSSSGIEGYRHIQPGFPGYDENNPDKIFNIEGSYKPSFLNARLFDPLLVFPNLQSYLFFLNKGSL